MPVISVIIPVFNAGSGLEAMLDAILRQTERDYEVLLVDDGSTDGSGAVCDGICERDSRFRCIHQINAGVSAARNRGLSEAAGEYLTFLDADDRIDSNYLSELLSVCRETGAEVCVCDVAVERDGVEMRRFTLSPRLLGGTEALELLLIRRELNSGPCAKLFRRELIAGLSFPPMKAYEDILFVKDAFLRAERIASTDRTTYHYIQNPAGAMSAFAGAPTSDILTATDELLDLCAQRRLCPETVYVTVSHLMQYVQPLLGRDEADCAAFVRGAQSLYRRHMTELLHCRAFPWKEKLVYAAFANGYELSGGRLRRIGV